MAILSVDLATSSWSNLGIVVLDRAKPPVPAPGQAIAPLVFREDIENIVACEIIHWDGSDLDEDVRRAPVNAEILAGRLNHLCASRQIRIIMLDGPQAWKSHRNGLRHARVSESQLNTAAKTGLPGMVKPITYRAFAEFCLDVYDALCRRGWKRLATTEQPTAPGERVLVESYPCAAWKSLGIKPLPSKRKARVSDLAEAYSALHTVVPFTVNHPPNHDQLQAIVGGLPGLALEERSTVSARIVGDAPRREDGHWREGFIVLPVAPQRTPNLHWIS